MTALYRLINILAVCVMYLDSIIIADIALDKAQREFCLSHCTIPTSTPANQPHISTGSSDYPQTSPTSLHIVISDSSPHTTSTPPTTPSSPTQSNEHQQQTTSNFQSTFRVSELTARLSSKVFTQQTIQSTGGNTILSSTTDRDSVSESSLSRSVTDTSTTESATVSAVPNQTTDAISQSQNVSSSRPLNPTSLPSLSSAVTADASNETATNSEMRSSVSETPNLISVTSTVITTNPNTENQTQGTIANSNNYSTSTERSQQTITTFNTTEHVGVDMTTSSSPGEKHNSSVQHTSPQGLSTSNYSPDMPKTSAGLSTEYLSTASTTLSDNVKRTSTSVSTESNAAGHPQGSTFTTETISLTQATHGGSIGNTMEISSQHLSSETILSTSIDHSTSGSIDTSATPSATSTETSTVSLNAHNSSSNGSSKTTERNDRTDLHSATTTTSVTEATTRFSDTGTKHADTAASSSVSVLETTNSKTIANFDADTINPVIESTSSFLNTDITPSSSDESTTYSSEISVSELTGGTSTPSRIIANSSTVNVNRSVTDSSGYVHTLSTSASALTEDTSRPSKNNVNSSTVDVNRTVTAQPVTNSYVHSLSTSAPALPENTSEPLKSIINSSTLDVHRTVTTQPVTDSSVNGLTLSASAPALTENTSATLKNSVKSSKVDFNGTVTTLPVTGSSVSVHRLSTSAPALTENINTPQRNIFNSSTENVNITPTVTDVSVNVTTVNTSVPDEADESLSDDDPVGPMLLESLGIDRSDSNTTVEASSNNPVISATNKLRSNSNWIGFCESLCKDKGGVFLWNGTQNVALSTKRTDTSKISFPVTQSVSNPSSTVHLSSRYDDKIPAWDSAMFRLNFSISFDLEWKSSYSDVNTQEYKNLAGNIERSLLQYYLHCPGLRRVVVYRLRSGSTVCNYSIEISTAVYRDNIVNATITSLDNTSLSLTAKDDLPLVGNLTTGYINGNRLAEISTAYAILQQPCYVASICPVGYVCKLFDGGATCIHRCTEKNPCKNDGICYVNEQNSVQCRCKTDDSHVYYGSYCEEKDELLALEYRYIIAITIGVAAALIIIAGCVCFIRKRRRLNKMDYDYPYLTDMDEYTPLGPDMEIVPLQVHRGVDNKGFRSDIRLNDGREYTVYRDRESNKQSLVYQPSRRDHHNRTSNNRPNDVSEFYTSGQMDSSNSFEEKSRESEDTTSFRSRPDVQRSRKIHYDHDVAL